MNKLEKLELTKMVQNVKHKSFKDRETTKRYQAEIVDF